jgi:curved DNA-binding protein CbpA
VEATGDSVFAASDQESDPAVRAEISALKRELEGQDHFQRLGLERSASSVDARNAFIGLAKRYHPDRYSGEEEEVRTLVSEAFALMSAAHDTLADRDERKAYLSRLESGLSDEENREALRRILNAEQRFSQGEALFKQRAYTKALAVFKEILQVEPDESEFHAYYGWTHYLAHHGDAAAKRLAREHLEKSIQLAPQSPTGYYFLGQLLKACNDPTGARKVFKKVIELRPGHVEAERELRLIQMRKGRGDKSGGGIFGFGRKKK